MMAARTTAYARYCGSFSRIAPTINVWMSTVPKASMAAMRSGTVGPLNVR